MSPPSSQIDPATAPVRRSARTTRRAVDVAAVLVAHDGAAWLPAALAALAASTRTPAQVVCVDTGSTDGSAELLEAAYGTVLHLPRGTGYGAAVAAGLVAGAAGSAAESTPNPEWIWLLHDDCAVEPTTLESLLEHAEQSPSAGMLGPKVRDWHDPRVLVEVGLTIDPAGHRETGLERREYDQGQQDAVRDVLAVGTAGALVRRQLWDELGGLELDLPVFRDDLDLGWRINAAGSRVVLVPEARIRHVRAATTGRRSMDAATGRAQGIDRRHALFVLLAHAPAFWFALLLIRLLLATVLRTVGLLLTRQLPGAADEVRAFLGVVSSPRTILRARRARARTRTVSSRQLRPLFASRSVRLRARLGALTDRLGGGRAPATTSLGALGDPGPEGPDAVDDLTAGGGTSWRWLLRPGVLLFSGLALVSLVAERSVLSLRGGSLAGGVLLPPSAGARDLWAAYIGSWHEVSVGSPTLAPPGTGVLAVLSTVLFGKPWLAVDVLLLASVPLAGVTAYVAAGRVVRHQVLRVWAAVTWALLPVATGAVASGRLGPAVLQIGLPLLLLAAVRLLAGDTRVDGWSRAWATGLGLSVLVAMVPLLWPLAAAALLGIALVGVTSDGGGRRVIVAAIVSVVPAGVLFPWSTAALTHPSLLLGDLAGGPVDGSLAGWEVLLLSPGGPGVPVAFLAVGVLLAALGGTVRRSARPLALAAWGVALLSLGAAAVLSGLQVQTPGSGAATSVWPGPALQLAGGALLLAALLGGRGVRSRLAETSFGWRQLLAGVVAAAAVAMPVLAAASWIGRGADDPLSRSGRMLLPAFAQAELAAQPGLRVLVLAPGPHGRLAYDVTGAAGPRASDAGTPPQRSQVAQLDAIVADLATPRGSDAAQALATRAVRYVALREPDAELARILDGQPGLVRRTSGRVALWQVVAPANRLTVLPPELAQPALTGARAPALDALQATSPLPLPAGPEAARTFVPAGAADRLLVLADAQDRGWRASIDGRPLAGRTAWGWAQAFLLPPEGGQLVLRHEQAGRDSKLVVEAALILLVVVLSVPGRRPRLGLEDDVEDA